MQIKDDKLTQREFLINDPDGAIKLDFLKRLASEQLPLDDVKADGDEKTVQRHFTGELILGATKRFIKQEGLTHILPHHLAFDVKATPLLREIGTDDFAFLHPTIQDYLAASALAKRDDCEMVFCRAFFNSALVELEVLPMTLGLVSDPNALYTTLSQLPESLNYANLRLRARGLGYTSKVNEQQLTNLSDALVSVVTEKDERTYSYSDPIIASFSNAAGNFLDRFVEALTIILRSPPPFTSFNLAMAIAKLGGDKALEALLEALEKGNVVVQSDAALALGTLGDRRAVDSLIAVLDKPESITRSWAAHSLGEIGDDRALEKLIEVLKTDNKVYVRWNAARAIGKIGSNQAVEKLEPLKYEENDIRGPAALALGMLGNKEVTEILLEILEVGDPELRFQAVSALEDIGDERAVEGLLKALKEKNLEVRSAAADALAKIDGERAVEGLIEALEHKVGDELSDVHWRAAKALGEIGGEKATEVLLITLKSNEHVGARWRAAEALGKIGGDRATAGLLEALNDEDKGVQRSAALALGRLGHREVLDECLEALHHPEEPVAQRAAEAVGEIGGESAVPELLNVIGSNQIFVRRSAAKALEKIKGEELANGLVKALSHKDSFVRRKATEIVIYYTDSEQALKELSQLASTDISEIRTEARKAQQQFYRRLEYFQKEPSLLRAEEIGRETALEETRAFIAHEVKSAIGPLRVMAQLLDEAVQSPTLDRDKLTDYTQRILKQVEAAYEVVNEYVDFTKPLRLNREPTDINQLIEHSLAEARAECDQHHIEVVRHFNLMALASVDRALMAQVLRNVLLNAIEAMEHGGRLTITTRLEAGQVLIQISDTGTGIKPEDLSRVFELGFTTKLGRRGAGIGLALARRIISEGHGGDITITNKVRRESVTVTIRLPVTKEAKSDGK